ncbi:MAG: exodeoxyribonuclease III [candidate division WS1 bacterium]|jgi:exodeoxyribonuclease-3|nr:exodeoxyribonuclease III [candidate division WS1 bacterium]
MMANSLTMKIATWNVNSVRSRIPTIERFLKRVEPDVLCMQETKVRDDDFPVEAFSALGYEVLFAGEKSYSGVATASRIPMKLIARGFDGDGAEDAARLLAVEVQRIPIVNSYVPQGRDPKDERFQYKLRWFARLREWLDERYTPRKRLLWVGDMNVAPEERDVHAPQRLSNHPDFHPDARRAFAETAGWGFVDCFRLHNDEDQQYTFYDYRDTKSVEKKHGWRVDHIMATKPLAKLCSAAWIDIQPRLGENPSDHTPLLAEFDL